jgi:hypothetical protein
MDTTYKKTPGGRFAKCKEINSGAATHKKLVAEFVAKNWSSTLRIIWTIDFV